MQTAFCLRNNFGRFRIAHICASLCAGSGSCGPCSAGYYSQSGWKPCVVVSRKTQGYYPDNLNGDLVSAKLKRTGSTERESVGLQQVQGSCISWGQQIAKSQCTEVLVLEFRKRGSFCL